MAVPNVCKTEQVIFNYYNRAQRLQSSLLKFQATLAVLGAAQRLSQWSGLIKSNKQGNHIRGKKGEIKNLMGL